jgi:hypothetical protein
VPLAEMFDRVRRIRELAGVLPGALGPTRTMVVCATLLAALAVIAAGNRGIRHGEPGLAPAKG